MFQPRWPTAVVLSGAALCATLAGQPFVQAVQNNYSYTLQSMPDYGIAPGSLFIIKGTGLSNQPASALQSSAPPGLPTTLNGASVTIMIGGAKITPAIYYTAPTQIAAVLPSTTPIGDGMVIINTQGVSQLLGAGPIHVVPSAFGLDTLNGTGSGSAIAQDADFNLLTPTHPASPGQTIILWGSGVGADTSNDDKTFPMHQNNLASIVMEVDIGGIPAVVSYRGRSPYPGVDQIVVTVPPDVPPGCFVSIVVRSGTNSQLLNSNFATIPVAGALGPCSDPVSEQSLFTAALGHGVVNLGILGLTQSPGASYLVPSASLFSYTQDQLSTYLASLPPPVSPGSCIVIPPTQSPDAMGIIPLPAGESVTVTGPGGATTMLQAMAPGIYSIGPGLPWSNPASGGVVTFSNGSGGAAVGAFTASMNVPPQLVWSNTTDIMNLNRSEGVTVAWSGGDPNSYVTIRGGSYVAAQPNVSVSFICLAPTSAQTFTVPGAVLLSLPPAAVESDFSPSLGITGSSVTTFSASGLDLGIAVVSQVQGFDVSYE